MPPQQRATLQDMLNYAPEEYLTGEDISLIQGTFKNNEKLIKVLRKLLLPTSFDPDLPIEEIKGDVWMVDKDWASVPVDEIKPLVVARADAIKFIIGGLIKLKVIANSREESKEEKEARRQKDSSR